jgi:hypothetical protein
MGAWVMVHFWNIKLGLGLGSIFGLEPKLGLFFVFVQCGFCRVFIGAESTLMKVVGT